MNSTIHEPVDVSFINKEAYIWGLLIKRPPSATSIFILFLHCCFYVNIARR